jgi:2-methylisocitrate lyase-like PEP mutase family enzyme
LFLCTGLKSKDNIAVVVKAVNPKSFNLLIGWPRLSVAKAANLGVSRISVGGALVRAAWSGFLHASNEIAENGTFDGLVAAHSGGVLNAMFAV